MDGDTIRYAILNVEGQRREVRFDYNFDLKVVCWRFHDSQIFR